MSNEFRVRLVTKDGSLVQNRLGDGDMYNDPEFVKFVLISDCREKGVRLLSHKRVSDGIEGIVEWLR
jgi:hypothetical protein